jgi:ATP-dependent RNA helicase RhlB
VDLISVLKAIIKKITQKKRSARDQVPGQRAHHQESKEPTDAIVSIENAINRSRAPATPNKRAGKRLKSAEKEAPKRPVRERKKKSPAWDPSQFEVSPMPGKTRFHDLDLPEEVLHAVADLGFQYCTAIQAEILPSTLAGRDAGGRAQTGTGKTAAFLITVITRMLRETLAGVDRAKRPRVLVLAPTRELVVQIAEEARSLTKYTALNVVTVFGGMDYEKQRRKLTQNRIDIVVATPGRLLDFSRHNDIVLDRVEVLIIDEADRMLDMGFIPDVRKIISLTPHKSKRQTLLFSATLTPEVTRLAAQWTKDPVMVEIEPEQVAVKTVEQIVYIVTTEEKYALLYNIITRQNLERVIVFCNRKDETRRLSDLFTRNNINCAVLSGDVPQNRRIRTLDDFKAGKIRMLVATDVAGRGIHIEGMDHVINYTLPRDPEDYVHRIGRTGRAGAVGTSISFADEDDSFFIPAIEELIGKKLPCTHPEEEWLTPPPMPKKSTTSDQKSSTSSQRRRTSGSRPRRPSGGVRRRPPRGPRQRKKPLEPAA